VTDTGVGISSEQQSALFQPFTQADSSTSRRYGGTGLGLSIVKQLVELMGGRIGIESAPGRGSTFWLEMPLVARSGPGVRRAPALDAAFVLLVEDQDCARGALTAYLASFGMQVLQAADATAALACLRETPRRVAYLVLDAGVLAAGGGAALIDSLRDDAHADLRTVLLIVPGIPVADDLPVDGAVLKPVTRAELLAALAPCDDDETDAARAVHGAAPAIMRRVLLVDDNPMNLQVAAAMLERLGLAVDSAASGEEALARLAERRYDVVLMDEQMPGMDGREATRRLREREGAAQRTPVLALTANADAGAEQRCLDAGMDAYLAKPVRRSALRDALVRWIPELRG
jgi:CheY-like chemotaxis protein